MVRSVNTDRNGDVWTESTKKAIWEKGESVSDFSKHVWRYDQCGRPMKWTEHGNRQSEHGWEIDHINPVANGGNDDLSNLQPLHWENNSSKGDKLNWGCP